eukprot:2310121-Amphidinium_carterae.1
MCWKACSLLLRHQLFCLQHGLVKSRGLIRLGCPSGFAITLVEESDAEGYAQQGQTRAPSGL